MADIGVKGDPDLNAVINDSGGSSGKFQVYDDNASTVRFRVDASGRVRVHGAIERDSTTPLRLTNLNSTAGTLVEFRNGASSTRRLRIDVNAGRLELIGESGLDVGLKADGGDAALAGDELVFDAATDGRLRVAKAGTEYLKIENSTQPSILTSGLTTPELRISSDGVRFDAQGSAAIVPVHEYREGSTLQGTLQVNNNSLGLREKLQLVATADLGLHGDWIRLRSSSTVDGDIALFAIDNEDRLSVNTVGSNVFVEAEKKSEGNIVDNLVLKAKECHLQTDQTSGRLADFIWGSGVRLHLDWDATDDEVRWTTVRDTDWALECEGSQADIRLTNAGAAEFRVTNGTAANSEILVVNRSRQIRWYYDGDRFGFWRRTVNGSYESAYVDYGTGTARGVLELRADSSNTRPGVVSLNNPSDDYTFCWTDSDHRLRWSDVDPEDAPDTGFPVNDGPLKVVAQTVNFVLNDSDCGIVHTNSGATSQVQFTLPAASSGLQFTFVNVDTDGIRVRAATGDDIEIDGTVSGLGGLAEVTSGTGQVLRLLAVNGTNWIAVQVVGAWSVV